MIEVELPENPFDAFIKSCNMSTMNGGYVIIINLSVKDCEIWSSGSEFKGSGFVFRTLTLNRCPSTETSCLQKIKWRPPSNDTYYQFEKFSSHQLAIYFIDIKYMSNRAPIAQYSCPKTSVNRIAGNLFAEVGDE